MESRVSPRSIHERLITLIYNRAIDASAFFAFSAFGCLFSLALLHLRHWMGFEISGDVIAYFYQGAVAMCLIGIAIIVPAKWLARSTYPELDRDVSIEEACARLDAKGAKALLVKAGWYFGAMAKFATRKIRGR